MMCLTINYKEIMKVGRYLHYKRRFECYQGEEVELTPINSAKHHILKILSSTIVKKCHPFKII